MRPSKDVARAALIAVLALVAVPPVVWSQPPGATRPIGEARFEPVVLAPAGTASTSNPEPILDPALDSDGRLAPGEALSGLSATTAAGLPPQPAPAHRAAVPIVRVRSTWQYDPEISWYGPGFYGNRTACGLAMTTSLIGVAHRSLPCGTWVTFRHGGVTLRMQVVDRGPYVAGRQWDLTGGACLALDHCYTGPIYFRMG